MKHILMILCLLNYYCTSITGEQTPQSKGPFHLITTLYNEVDEKRAQEYIECFEINLSHPSIATINVLYDTTHDNDKNLILNYLMTKDIAITFTTGRPTFGLCFDVANNCHPDNKVIIANADIYFNETLALLNTYALHETFLALTRWNVLKDGSIKPYIWPNGKEAIYSQDAWIFQTPLKKFDNDAIVLGVPHCDGRIAFQAHKAGLRVLNPCKTIQCCHLHLTGIRNYTALPFPKGEAMSVAWGYLE